MDPRREEALLYTRRQLFGKAALGIGTAALASVLHAEDGKAHALKGLPHFPPKAKRVIYLTMNGGPSQMDLWDYKPKMGEYFDKDLPDAIRKGQRITTMTSGQTRFPVAPTKFQFEHVANNADGVWISELLPYTKKVAKELCVVHSMYTEAINHDPAVTFIQTGSELPGRPSIGAWVSYGLGTTNENLPTYVVLHSTFSNVGGAQAVFTRLWGAGFLPGEHQGVAMRSSGDPVLHLNDPDGMDRSSRRQVLDGIAKMNQLQLAKFGDPEIAARIQQYEMAYRLQTSVPDLMDFSKEPASTFELYGEEAKKPGTFAANCLLARRMAERDVRFIQIFHRGWDMHGDLTNQLPRQAKDVDQACYGLITDLKQRGLLDDTLVIWGGEFGRTVYCQGPLSKENYGRDHHPRCFTIWMAGGGVKPGVTYGKTDDFSYNIIDDNGQPLNPTPGEFTPGAVHVHDLNATILRLMGVDHTKLTYNYQGRDFRLTDVHGHVVDALMT
jgi:hypothetical protein